MLARAKILRLIYITTEKSGMGRVCEGLPKKHFNFWEKHCSKNWFRLFCRPLITSLASDTTNTSTAKPNSQRKQVEQDLELFGLSYEISFNEKIIYDRPVLRNFMHRRIPRKIKKHSKQTKTVALEIIITKLTVHVSCSITGRGSLDSKK